MGDKKLATKYTYPLCTFKVMSFGAELELADWPNREPLPSGMKIDENERAGVNSNGVAVDGSGKLYHLGGEILTAPSTSVEGPADQMAWIKNRWPEAVDNFRTGLNVHVRVPGLRDDLKKLKRLQTFIHKVMPELLPVLCPLPKPRASHGLCEIDYDPVFADPDELKGAVRDWKRWCRNLTSFLPQMRFDLQMAARTPKEFFEAEAIDLKTGKVHWALATRACVNLRQLLQTDTVEFRHFTGTSSPDELLNATLWCKAFLEAALDGENVSAYDLLKAVGPGDGRAWPKLASYDPWLDRGYHYTSWYINPLGEVPARIKEWLRISKTERERRGRNEPNQKAATSKRR